MKGVWGFFKVCLREVLKGLDDIPVVKDRNKVNQCNMACLHGHKNPIPQKYDNYKILVYMFQSIIGFSYVSLMSNKL